MVDLKIAMVITPPSFYPLSDIVGFIFNSYADGDITPNIFGTQ